MQVLMCNYEYPPLGGGGGVFTASLAQELAGRHRVTVLTSAAPGVGSTVAASNVEVRRAPVLFRRRYVANVPSMLAYVPSALLQARRSKLEGFDLVNSHFAVPSGPVGMRLSRRFGAPHVLSLHAGDLYDPSKWLSPHRHPLLRAVVRRVVESADAVVVQSRDTLDNLRRYYTTRKPAEIIPLGIQPPPALRASRERYGFGPDDLLLVTIGRLVPRKATGQLFDVVQRLGARARLIVIGEGPERGALEQAAAECCLRTRVRFVGCVADLVKWELLSIADLYVSTSQHEGFGLVFLEAMAFGLPIVCYDRGGHNDFLENGRTGYVVPLNDLDAFGTACRRLASQRTLREAIASRNRSAAAAYSIAACAARYEALFERLLTPTAAMVPLVAQGMRKGA